MVDQPPLQPKKSAAGSSDHLANERTFLAWIRTSIALMGFGFVVVKFALFIRQISLVMNKTAITFPSRGYSAEIGIFLVGIGIAMTVYAYFRYRITEKQLVTGTFKPSYLLAVSVTILIMLAGIALVIYLFTNR